MSATAAMLPASAETLVLSGRCFLSIFDANQPQFLYEFPTIGIWLKLIKRIRRNPVVGRCSLWRAASVGNRPFTMPWECDGEVVPEGGRNTPGVAHGSGFRVRLSGL